MVPLSVFCSAPSNLRTMLGQSLSSLLDCRQSFNNTVSLSRVLPALLSLPQWRGRLVALSAVHEIELTDAAESSIAARRAMALFSRAFNNTKNPARRAIGMSVQ